MHRRIDHLVVAVHDLSKAADFYRALGFQVGARNRHPWGTENHVVQMPGSFIELIAIGDPAAIAQHEPGIFSFGAFIQDYLANREGLAMLVLDSRDATADAGAFAAGGIGAFAPFSFERKATTPEGREVRVAFSLAFAQDPAAAPGRVLRLPPPDPRHVLEPGFPAPPERRRRDRLRRPRGARAGRTHRVPAGVHRSRAGESRRP